jgi:hypothetical protein
LTASFLDWLILVLLLWPVDPPVPSHVPPPVFAALVRQAEVLDLVGPRERWRSDFRAELLWCRHHLRILRDAPPSRATAYLPPHADAQHACQCVQDRLESLRLRRMVLRHLHHEIGAEIEDLRVLLAVWTHVVQATDPGAGVASVRYTLQVLRIPAGDGWELPPAGAMWRFAKVD